MRCRRPRHTSGLIPLIDRAPVNPLDPIAHRVAIARSGGQGGRPVFRMSDMSSDEARPENVGCRRSLALGRSEHDGRLMAYRDGGACAAVPSIIALLTACSMIVVMTAPTSAEQPPGDPAVVTASTRGSLPDISSSVSSSPDSWAAHIAEAAKRFAIPERWIRSVMAVESVNDPTVLSPKGAIGLMQVMPATWAELRARHRLGSDPWQSRDNILAGAAYLREMHDRYGSVAAMLAAYNAGPARYDAHLATGRALPAETIDYVAKITAMIDGTVSLVRSAGSASRPTWSRAPLFVARSTVRSDADPQAAAPPSDRPSKPPAIVDLSALVPFSDGLFVRRPEPEGETR